MNTKYSVIVVTSILLIIALLVLAGRMPTKAQGTGTTTRVSVASSDTQGNGDSDDPSVSADGRYVAFESEATNLVSGDTNDWGDIFVHDRQTGQTTRISVASGGTQGNGGSYDPSISDDGRYVVFESTANNLVSGDTNGFCDVFVRDRQTGQTIRVSVVSGGTQANDGCYDPSISDDGRYVTFESEASNLGYGDTNNECDIFVHDRQTGQTTRVSVASGGTQGNDGSYDPSISADGRYVVFESIASNLVSGDTNGKCDVFVHDRQTGQTTRVSVASGGTQGNDGSYDPSISTDGRYVAFESEASNLVSGDTNGECDVFVHDRQMGQTIRVSVVSGGTQGNDGSYDPSISTDGRYVAFESPASNLVSGDTNGEWDIFVHDLQIGQTTRVSVASGGSQGNDWSADPSTSADGRYVAFESTANNLVIGDTNGERDVFVRDRMGGGTSTVYLPVVLRQPTATPTPTPTAAPSPTPTRTPTPGEHDLWDISCHIFFWWHRASYGAIPEYNDRVFCDPAERDHSEYRNIMYDQHGRRSGFDLTIFFETSDTYAVHVRNTQYDGLGRTSEYNAQVGGSYFDAFDQTLSYSPEDLNSWSKATVVKAYSDTEYYEVHVTPCWVYEGLILDGYRTEVYGGSYNGEGVTIGECP
jgi:Tol biopolymer transport system component